MHELCFPCAYRNITISNLKITNDFIHDIKYIINSYEVFTVKLSMQYDIFAKILVNTIDNVLHYWNAEHVK